MSQPPRDLPAQPDPFDQDESIPLLTEVVSPVDQGAELESRAAATLASPPPQVAISPSPSPPSPPSSPSPPSPPSTTAAPAPGAPAPAAPASDSAKPPPGAADPRTLAELAARIEHGVTSRMLEQAGPMLEASLQSMVAPLIEQAAVQIAQDLHDAFSHLVRDLVARAVAEELVLLQARELDDPDAGSAPSTPSLPPPLDAQAGLAGSL